MKKLQELSSQPLKQKGKEKQSGHQKKKQKILERIFLKGEVNSRTKNETNSHFAVEAKLYMWSCMLTVQRPEYTAPVAVLLGSQFLYVHHQPLAVVSVVDRLHLHHCGLDPGFILSERQQKQTKINPVLLNIMHQSSRLLLTESYYMLTRAAVFDA